MKVFLDTEFLDDGKTTELISIALVAEDGHELYYVNADADFDRILDHDLQRDSWMHEHVLKHIPHAGDGLTWELDYSAPEVLPKATIARDVEAFLRDREPELWAYYSATDHVVLYQLFGSLIEANRDHGIPMRTNCLKQEEESIRRRIRRNRQHTVPEDMSLDELVERVFHSQHGNRPRQELVTQHHALHDARHDMEVGRWLGLIS